MQEIIASKALKERFECGKKKKKKPVAQQTKAVNKASEKIMQVQTSGSYING